MIVHFREEIFRIILGWLENPDLRLAVLACKGFKAFTIPLLYSKIEWRWGTGE